MHDFNVKKNVFIDKLDDIVNKYDYISQNNQNKACQSNAKHICWIWGKNNDKVPKLKVGYHVRKSKYRNIFAKGYAPNWTEEAFVITKIKSTFPETYVIENLDRKEIFGTYSEKKFQKTNQTEFRAEKVIKRKSHKLYVTWKIYDNMANCWIDKTDI